MQTPHVGDEHCLGRPRKCDAKRTTFERVRHAGEEVRFNAAEKLMRRLLPSLLIGCAGVLVGFRLDQITLGSRPMALSAAVAPASSPIEKWEQLEFRDEAAPVPCPEGVPIIVVIGQSNAANSVGHRFEARHQVFEMLNGRCYKAAGPLAGADLAYGSYWPLVGDLLIKRNFSRSVIFLGLAKGNTTVAQWADPHGLGGYLGRKLDEVRGVTHVVWHQGEADSKTAADRYQASLEEVIRNIRSHAPLAKIVIAQASVCTGRPRNEAILHAQSAVVDLAHNVYPGPNSDLLAESEFRYDGCHFSERGARRLSEMWADKLAAAGKAVDAH
jgi:hypothetical protein